METRYDIIKLIHKSMAGGLYLAESKSDGSRHYFRHFNVKQPEKVWKESFDSLSEKLAQISHPHIVPLTECVLSDDGPILVSAFADGVPLDEFLVDGQLSPDEVKQLAIDMLGVLETLHAAGFIHGALSTSSITMVTQADGSRRGVITDLGVAQLTEGFIAKEAFRTDAVFTPPETAKKGLSSATETSDLFALGQICYVAMAGGHPFAGMKRDECARSYKQGKFPPLMEFVPGIHESLSQWIGFLTEGEASQRYASAKNALEGLHSVTMTTPGSPLLTGAGTPRVMTSAASVARTAQPARPVVAQPKTSKAPWIVVAVLLVAAAVGFILKSQSQPDSSIASTEEKAASSEKDGGKENTPKKSPPKTAAKTPSKPAKPKPSTPNKPDPNAIRPLTVQTINRVGADEPEACGLDSQDVLDAYIAMGAPSSDKRATLKAGKYFQGILCDPSVKEYEPGNSLIYFKTPQQNITPNVLANSSRGLTAGSGWDLTLRVPAKRKKAIIAALYLHQENCDIRIKLTDPATKKELNFIIPSEDDGARMVPLVIPRPVKNQLYNIRIEVAKAHEEEFKAAFLACVVLKGE